MLMTLVFGILGVMEGVVAQAHLQKLLAENSDTAVSCARGASNVMAAAPA